MSSCYLLVTVTSDVKPKDQDRAARAALGWVGEIEEAAGVYAETKIEELAERKLRLDKPDLAHEWDKIQRRERQALIPKIEQSRSLEEGLVQTLSLSRIPEE